MKFATTLAKTVFTIALIACMFSTAAARTPSVEIMEPDAIAADSLYRMPSLAIPQPMQVEILEKAPLVDMGFHPIDSDPTRKSLIWNAFPEPLNAEGAERMPSDAVRQPLNAEGAERMPTQAIREPLDIECCGPTMHFDLKKAVSAEILIYSVDGRLVRRLSEALPNGESSLTWDGRDDRGSRAASGVYFARVQANEETGQGKLVLVR